jgi:hypothetical protein
MDHRLLTSEYDRVGSLGSGSIGKCYLARQKTTHREIVIKFVKNHPANLSEFQGVLQELFSLSHSALVPIIGYANSDPKKNRPMLLASDYFAHGSLLSMITSEKPMDNEMKMRILFGVAEALRFLHERGFVHGALTLGNILFDAHFEPKVSDYGLSPIRSGDATSSHDIPPDVFYYGCLVYSVLTEQLVDPHHLPSLPDTMPSCFQELISSCWNVNASRCFTFQFVVLKYMRDECILPLDALPRERFREYQANSLSPSFVTSVLIPSLTTLHRLRDENRELIADVEYLKSELASLSFLLSKMKVESHAAHSGANSITVVHASGMRRAASHREVPAEIPAKLPSHPVAEMAEPSGFGVIHTHGMIARQFSVAPTSLPMVLSEFGSIGPVAPIEGIFARMTREAGGVNVVHLGLVCITGNSLEKDRDADLAEIVNPQWNRCWTSQESPNSWIQFDFGAKQVIISSYSIKTYPCAKNFSHLRSWVLEGCTPAGKWFELDAREDNSDLNGKSRAATFTCNFSVHVNLVRLRQTGPNHHNDHYLIVANIEFFGDIVG